MPRKDDAPELAVCDGCGREMPADDLTQAADERYHYCQDCAAHREPEIEFRGRRLTVSEARLQADDEPDLLDKVKQVEKA